METPRWEKGGKITQECLQRIQMEEMEADPVDEDSQESEEEAPLELHDEEELKDPGSDDVVIPVEGDEQDAESEEVQADRAVSPVPTVDRSSPVKHSKSDTDNLLRELKIRLSVAERSALNKYLNDVDLTTLHPVSAFVDGMRVRQAFDQAAYNESLSGFKEIAARLGKTTTSIENATRDQAAHTLKVLKEVKELHASVKDNWKSSLSSTSSVPSNAPTVSPSPSVKFQLPKRDVPVAPPEKTLPDLPKIEPAAVYPPTLAKIPDLFGTSKKNRIKEEVASVNKALECSQLEFSDEWDLPIGEILEFAGISVSSYEEEYGYATLVQAVKCLDLSEYTLDAALLKYKTGSALAKAIWDNTDDLQDS
ncbi:hypothetical protein 2 [Tree fern varicosa-like virus]|uniref:Uncharacterized protein n=1 Tax=Tree fern varicosa-like virus TaxID=2933191 RepID=A0A9C7LLP9_9RHAB|nr:hypothetical protein 2 [Tree fern varicosa-like virus]CAI5383997.1 hypothetical protein 2 [Tree fern varicosa-like virus]